MAISLKQLSRRQRIFALAIVYLGALSVLVAATRPLSPATGPATTRAAAVPAFAAMAYYDTSSQ